MCTGPASWTAESELQGPSLPEGRKSRRSFGQWMEGPHNGAGSSDRTTLSMLSLRVRSPSVPRRGPMYQGGDLDLQSGCDGFDSHGLHVNYKNEKAYNAYIARWKAGLETGNIAAGGEQVSRYIRRYMFETHGSRCATCGWCCRHPTTGLVPLALDHIDGDWNNTTEQNLRLLCPNCHSLTPTYGSLNRGRGRLTRLKRLGV